jgi:hypothetical protein
MSTLRTNNVQVGQSPTATNNFTLYQPSVPDGTVRLGVGNTGATTLDAVTVTNAGNVAVPSLTVNGNNISAVNSLGFRNRIINGNMAIDQRNAGASVSTGYSVDRFANFQTYTSNFTFQRNGGSVTPPAGFVNYLGVTVGTGRLVSAGDAGILYQIIEGLNVADFAYGTSGAVTSTLSFWVRSSLTGTHGGVIKNNANNRSYPFGFSVSAANTWEYKTIVIPGDTTGTWLTDNGKGIVVSWSLGSGSTYTGAANSWQGSDLYGVNGQVNLCATTGATFYITGVQLEAGTVASPFERRDYGRELIMCQRYCYRHSAEGDIDNFAPLGIGRYFGTNNAQLYVPFKVTMRTPPSTVTQIGNIAVNDTTFSSFAITLALNETASSGATVTGTTTSGTTAGFATTFYANNTANAALIFSAEL